VPIVPTTEILRRAFADRYGVAAINVVNDLTLEAVLAAAASVEAPVIIQTSVKTVKSIGMGVLYAMFTEMARSVPVPVALHLDHCPDREVISACLAAGWNSVLFDGSRLSVEDNLSACREIVAEARTLGAGVEGEIEPIQGVEDGIGSDDPTAAQSLEVALDFIRRTGVDCFAPAIGNAHGMYRTTPTLDGERVSAIVAAEPVPIALHGGSGLTAEQFSDLIARGCCKVNISTALKVRFMDANRTFLNENEGRYDPPTLFAHVRAEVMAMAASHMTQFGSAGRAW
jgi:tagatose 1,6-diphosphate aldolase GatY/KbaY